MSVIRVVHNKENPYVQLNKQALWNEKLSLKATGLWARCMSRPDDWRFNIKELSSKSKEGRRAIDGAIKELIAEDYAVRIEHWEKSKDGKFKHGGVEYVFFEFPATKAEKLKVLEEFKKSFRHCGFGNCRDGDSRNGELPKTEGMQTEKTPSPPLLPKTPHPKPEKKEEVFLKDKIRKQLADVATTEFESAWSEYEKAPRGSVKSIKGWLRAVIKRKQEEKTIAAADETRAKRHQFQAENEEVRNLEKRTANPRKETVSVIATNSYVDISHGRYSTIVDYRVSDEEWEEKTGWKPLTEADIRKLIMS